MYKSTSRDFQVSFGLTRNTLTKTSVRVAVIPKGWTGCPHKYDYLHR